MKIVKKEIDKDLVDAIQARSIELAGLERLIGFSLSNAEYEIPQEKIDELMKKHKDTNAEYELLKQQVTNLIKEEVGDANISWNLDYETRIAEITIK